MVTFVHIKQLKICTDMKGMKEDFCLSTDMLHTFLTKFVSLFHILTTQVLRALVLIVGMTSTVNREIFVLKNFHVTIFVLKYFRTRAGHTKIKFFSNENFEHKVY